MQEKYRIGDVEYTIHEGCCPGGDNVLCTCAPGANQELLKEWMGHYEANQALRRAAARIRPVNGSSDDRVARQLDHSALQGAIAITRRKISKPSKSQTACVLQPTAEPPATRAWWQDGARPLGPGCWELNTTDNSPQTKEEKGQKLAMEIPLGEAGALAFIGPWGWIFLVIGIGASITAAMLTDSELEQWAKCGPFSREPNCRWTKQFTGQRPRYAYAALLGELMRPQVTIRHAGRESAAGPSDVIVEVLAPGLDKTRSKIIVHASAQKVGAVIQGVSHQGPDEPNDYEPHFQAYHRVEEIEPHDGLSGLCFYYKGLSALHNRYRWRVRARHAIEQDGITVSMPAAPGAIERIDTLKIDSSEPGWVYAEL